MIPARGRPAGSVGLVGGVLGVVAGSVQAVAGPRIPEWTGDKDSPIALGLLTIALSGIAVFGALDLRRADRAPGARPASDRRRVVAALTLVVPGGLCFSTVGALWFVPGTLLLAAAGLALLAGSARRTREVIATYRLPVLVSALGAAELLIVAGGGPPETIAVGVVGGLALGAASWTRSVRLGVVLLLIGTLPFAVLTWWSVVSPLLAFAGLLLGAVVLHGRPPAPGQVAAVRGP